MNTFVGLLLALVFGSRSLQVLAASCPKSDPSHTLCLPTKGRSCSTGSKTNLELSKQDQSTILRFHNHVRSKFAMGMISEFPPSSNMMALKWNDELAEIAQRWANQCIDDHDENRSVAKYPRVGQNLFSSWKWPSDGSVVVPIQQSIQGWLDELSLFKDLGYNISRVANFGAIGHFTQMIWAETTDVGCGFSGFESDGGWTRLLVCNYGPGGNVRQNGVASVYKVGPPCSACPRGSSCDKALCS